jgi:hypothetical protein
MSSKSAQPRRQPTDEEYVEGLQAQEELLRAQIVEEVVAWARPLGEAAAQAFIATHAQSLVEAAKDEASRFGVTERDVLSNLKEAYQAEISPPALSHKAKAEIERMNDAQLGLVRSDILTSTQPHTFSKVVQVDSYLTRRLFRPVFSVLAKAARIPDAPQDQVNGQLAEFIGEGAKRIQEGASPVELTEWGPGNALSITRLLRAHREIESSPQQHSSRQAKAVLQEVGLLSSSVPFTLS